MSKAKLDKDEIHFCLGYLKKNNLIEIGKEIKRIKNEKFADVENLLKSLPRQVSELNENERKILLDLKNRKEIVDVDIKKEIMVVDGSMHADLEKELLDTGSLQDDLWGINLYPDLFNDDFIEFDSMINMRPSHGNRSRGVTDSTIRTKIITIVGRLIIR